MTQRNASITGNLQQILAQIETVPRADIRNAYSNAMDAQQRFLVMRGQLDKLQTELCLCAGETSPDMKFTLETVNCVGARALGPVVVVDGEYAGQVTTDKVKSIIEGCK